MIKDSRHPRFGVGLYSIPEASRLLKSPVNSVRRWLNPKEGLVHRALDPGEQTITFLELMELHFIKLFRDQGVSLPTIRRAAKTAAAQFGTMHPFAVHRFDTDGRTVFATLLSEEKDTAIVEDLKHGQYVFDGIMRPFFKHIEYGQDEAIRFWPQGMSGRVVLDPERQFGKPIDSRTGVPATALYMAVQAGEDPVCVAEWFDVPLESVRAAVSFEEHLVA
ncbi:MAG: DUF433 domain-containing protein [Rhodopirellula sp.]|nr:DUF433 domain-containing protein [Rhodopirellula sp.]